MRRCQIRQARRAFLAQDRQRLHRVAGDLRDRRWRARALVIDPAGQQVLHRLAAAAIGNVRDVDADRRIEQHASQMIGPARPGRAVLHLRLVGLGVGDELLQVAGGKIRARHQHQRLIHDQHHRREIGHGVVQRRLVERLVLGVRADVAEHELVAVGRRLRDAVRPGHAAGAADVFHDDGLVKLGAQAVGDDAGDGVGRSAGAERRNHGDRPVRPVLRLRRMCGGNQARKNSRSSGEGGQSAQRCH